MSPIASNETVVGYRMNYGRLQGDGIPSGVDLSEMVTRSSRCTGMPFNVPESAA